MIKRRGLVALILFSLITLGIYVLYWIHKLAPVRCPKQIKTAGKTEQKEKWYEVKF